MVAKISVVVPSYKEDEDTINRCVDSIKVAAKNCPCPIEIYLALDLVGVGYARNMGAQCVDGDVLVFLDVDCTMSPGYLKEVYDRATDDSNIGGGTKWVKMNKYSLGRLLFYLPIAIILYWNRITVGAFWIKREYFTILAGFSLGKGEDLDFAIRLKRLAKLCGKNFRSIKNSYITWNTRSFDRYGQWFWLKKYRVFKEKWDEVEKAR